MARDISSVKNMPLYAKEYRYIVARESSSGVWFWGAWDDYDKASDAAYNIGGIVIYNEEAA